MICPRDHRGFSLIGLLVTFACMAVLSAIMLGSLNQAMTGAGAVQSNTVYSLEDKLNLNALVMGMNTYAMENRGRFLRPSELLDDRDRSVDTTACFYSAMIMSGHFDAKQLVSPHEQSGFVDLHYTYNRGLYDPAAGVFWDPSFEADLHDISHVSYGHMPLAGKRLRNQWRQAGSSAFPIIGSRGPRDGEITPTTYTVGRLGTWAGHFAFGDGHVAYMSVMELPGLSVPAGDDGHAPDHVFKMESGGDGSDAIIAFTRAMIDGLPELQFD